MGETKGQLPAPWKPLTHFGGGAQPRYREIGPTAAALIEALQQLPPETRMEYGPDSEPSDAMVYYPGAGIAQI